MECQVCSSQMRTDVIDQTYRCESCGFFSSEFPIEINSLRVINEDAREAALFPLRAVSFRQILDDCTALIPARGSILDVGCAHGWFMEAAKARGYRSFGIEPDDDMAARLRASNIDFMKGYFPEVVPADARFDAITFNDVFEHLPNLAGIATAVHEHLGESGILIVNLPVSDGVFFRLARGIARFGIDGPLCRMWQKGLPSPHLSYFSRTTVPRLLSKHGFELVLARDLPSVSFNGLYDRIRYDTELGFFKAAVTFMAAVALVPLAKAMPSDSRYFVFRKARR